MAFYVNKEDQTFSKRFIFGVDKNAALASVMYLDNGFTYKAN